MSYTFLSRSTLSSCALAVLLALPGASHAAPKAPQFASGGHVVEFDANAIQVAAGSHALRMEFVNSCGAEPESGPTRSRITYGNIWDGVTLTYDAPEGSLVRSTYRLAAHADPASIRLRYNAAVFVQVEGSLRINFPTGFMAESAPIAWQENEGKRVPVQVAFIDRGNDEIGFAVADYDPNEPLFIDPTLTWNTFLGSETDDQAFGIAIDLAGNVFVTGASDASWGTPVVPHHGGYDVFIAKLDPNGNLLWHTFLGGGGNEVATAIALAPGGDLYLSGVTYETWGSPLRPFGGVKDAFAAKVDSTGHLVWNTFLGSSADDSGNAVGLDSAGNVYVSGYSSAPWGTPVAPHNGGYDAFVAKLDPDGAVIWNTFLGSSGSDQANAIAVDATGNAYAAGFSTATWGSPVRALVAIDDSAFAAKVDSNGFLVWNTFLGGGAATATGISADATGDVYVTGSCRVASWGSPVRPFSGNQDAYAAKLDTNGALVWNTFLGAADKTTVSNAVAVDATGNVYLSGFSDGSWGAPVRPFVSNYMAFAVQLDSSGALTWNTYLGNTYGYAIGADLTGNVYVAGAADATWGAPVQNYHAGGLFDAFAAKVPVSGPVATPPPSPTPTPIPSPTPDQSPSATPVPSPTPSATPLPGIVGNFVIGDGNAVVGNHVTFWSANWADFNSLSAGNAPSGFKGFTSSTSPNPIICGGAWTSNPGNSAGPPSSVPSLITVIVSSSISKSGPTISGNVPKMAIVLTDPGYSPAPGHTGTGTVLAIFCP